jgi:hypothetical protein
MGNMSQQRSDVRTFSFKSERQSKGQGRPYTVTKAYRGRRGTAPLNGDLRTLKCSSKLQLKFSVTHGRKSDKHGNITNFFHIRRRFTTQDPIQIFSLKTISSNIRMINSLRQTHHILLCRRLHLSVLTRPSSGLLMNQVNNCWLQVGVPTVFTISLSIQLLFQLNAHVFYY